MTPSSTDSRLLDVAVDHFGRLGLEGASTRAIARDADTLMSSITYHFGGKEGLYLAAADHISAHLHGHIAPMLTEAAALCGEAGGVAQARAAIHTLIRGMTLVMLNDETEAMTRFIVREQADPTEAFDRIYNRIMGTMLDRLSSLLIQVSGQPVSIPVGLPFSELVDYQVARPRLGRAAETKVSLSLSLSLSSLSSLNNSEDVARPCGISSSLGKNLNDDDQVQGCLLLGVAFPLHFLIVFICSPSISPRRRSPHEKTDNETLDTYKT